MKRNSVSGLGEIAKGLRMSVEDNMEISDSDIRDIVQLIMKVESKLGEYTT